MVGNHFIIGSYLSHIFGVIVADDGPMATLPTEEKGGMPRHIHPQDQIQRRIWREGRFAYERQPYVHVELLEDVLHL